MSKCCVDCRWPSKDALSAEHCHVHSWKMLDGRRTCLLTRISFLDNPTKSRHSPHIRCTLSPAKSSLHAVTLNFRLYKVSNVLQVTFTTWKSLDASRCTLILAHMSKISCCAQPYTKYGQDIKNVATECSKDTNSPQPGLKCIHVILSLGSTAGTQTDTNVVSLTIASVAKTASAAFHH